VAEGERLGRRPPARRRRVGAATRPTRPGDWPSSRPRVGALAVPGEGALDAVRQLYPRCPAGQLAELGRVDELAVDLAGRHTAATVLGGDLAPARADDQVDHLAHRMRALAAGVEGLSPRPLP